MLLIPLRVRGNIRWSLLFPGTYSHTWVFPSVRVVLSVTFIAGPVMIMVYLINGLPSLYFFHYTTIYIIFFRGVRVQRCDLSPGRKMARWMQLQLWMYWWNVRQIQVYWKVSVTRERLLIYIYWLSLRSACVMLDPRAKRHECNRSECQTYCNTCMSSIHMPV